MQLSDYFATFNLFNLSVFFIAFLILDAIGFNISRLIKAESYLRLVFWIWGLGFFVFLWFILHFFLPFLPIYVWISIIILGIFNLPSYIKNSGPKTFITALTSFPYPLLIIPIIFKPLYFLLNSPPFYWDEMAYHFYSPAQIINETRWLFIGPGAPSLYHMVPKMLETSFVLMFSVTKTYAVARLLHFLMIFFTLYTIAIYIRRNIGLFPAIVYSFLSLLLSASGFLAASTWGYIDAGAAVLTNLFLISIIDLLHKPSKNKVYVSGIILGLAIGIKYTVLGFIGSVVIIGLIIFIISENKRLLQFCKNVKQINYQSVFIFFVLLIVFGGYWYIKNFIISGNPIYPFVFQCKNGWACATGRDFFQSWAMAIAPENYLTIKNIIFQNNDVLYYASVLSVIFGIIAGIIVKKRLISVISIAVILSFALEIILSRNLTGFELRYFYHWVLLIPLLLVLPLNVLFHKKRKYDVIFLLFCLYACIFFYSAGRTLSANVKRIYEPDFVPGYIRNYAMHRIALNDWIDYYFPKMNEIILWCGEKKQMQDIRVIDPSLIWFSNEGGMRAYMVNCRITSGESQYIASETKCTPGQSYQTYDPSQVIQDKHILNQKLICNSKESIKNLYIMK